MSDHGDQDDDPFEQEEPVGADAGEVEPVLEDPEEEGADQGAQHRGPPSREGGAADDCRHYRRQHDVEAVVARVHAPEPDQVEDPDEARRRSR